MKQPLFPLPAIKTNLIKSCSKTEFFLLPEGKTKPIIKIEANFHTVNL